jgi:hypothetical protein
MKFILAAAGTLLLAGCYQGHKQQHHKPIVDTVAAKQVCEIDTLAKEHEVIIGQLGLEKDQSKTIPAEKLREYRAEIDASYRFVVENCNNYNLCMQAHRYDERSCDASRYSWAESHRKFNQIAERLAELEIWRHKKRKHHGQAPHNECDCSSVFATGCCYDGD